MKVPETHEEVGQATHTALRKICDSKATSALYNYIHVMPKGEWTKIIKHLHKHMKQAPSTKTPASALKDAVMDLDYMGHPPLACFYCICCLFNDTDWDCFAGYLES